MDTLHLCRFIKKNNRILFQKRKQDEFWALPGGAIEVTERGRDVVKRELEEETGVQVTKEKLTYLGKTIMNEYQCIMYTYLVVLTEDVELKLQPEEVVDAKWVDTIELENMQEEIVESVWDRYLQFKANIVE